MIRRGVSLLLLLVPACAYSHVQNEADAASPDGLTTAPVSDSGTDGSMRSDAGPAAPPLTPSQFVEQLRAARCAAFAACRFDALLYDPSDGGGGCAADARIGDDWQEFVRAAELADAGELALRVDMALGCLSLTRSRCPRLEAGALLFERYPSLCDRVFGPAEAAPLIGASCEVNAQCGDTGYCSRLFVGCVRGVCERRPADGEPCDGPCTTEDRAVVICNRESDFRCVALRLTESGAEGDVCGIDTTNRVVDKCAAGFACVADDLGSDRGVCTRHPRIGEPCDGDAWTAAPCPRGLYCDGVCRPRPLPAAVPGASCNEQQRCDASQRLYCAASGVCERATGEVGSICNERERPRECLAGNYCDFDRTDLGADVRCVAAGTDGETCEYGAECLSTACEGGICVPAVCE